MKKIFITILLILCSISMYSQQSDLNLDKIINEHLKDFRNLVGQDANVYILFDYDLKNVEKDLNEHDYILHLDIDPKKLKGDDNFIVKFIVANENGQIVFKAINFRIQKINRKHLKFVNMGNGKEYY